MSEDDIQYITDYGEYERGIAAFTKQVLDDAWATFEPKLAFEREEKQKAEEVKLIQQKRVIRKSLKNGESFEDIADLLGIDMEIFENVLEQINEEDFGISSN